MGLIIAYFSQKRKQSKKRLENLNYKMYNVYCIQNNKKQVKNMNEIQLRALAKINLGLDVLRRREDGYHEVKMVMQTIRLFDKIHLIKRSDGKISIETNLPYLPNNEHNLAYRAADLLKRNFELKEGVHIRLFKYIPVAAGLAGGSSDAAAVLFGMNRIYQLGLTLEELMEIGVKIGADVPYCLMRGTALAEGIGEKLTRLPACPDCYVLIAKPGINVSTRMVYENLHANELRIHPDIDGMIAEMAKGNLQTMCDKMGNVLETVTVAQYPIIDTIKTFMKEHGAIGSMMSGSGPTVFGIYDDLIVAKQAYFDLKMSRLAQNVYLTTTFNIRGRRY